MRLGESRDNKGRHIGMQNDWKHVRSVNIGLVLLQYPPRRLLSLGTSLLYFFLKPLFF